MHIVLHQFLSWINKSSMLRSWALLSSAGLSPTPHTDRPLWDSDKAQKEELWIYNICRNKETFCAKDKCLKKKRKKASFRSTDVNQSFWHNEQARALKLYFLKSLFNTPEWDEENHPSLELRNNRSKTPNCIDAMVPLRASPSREGRRACLLECKQSSPLCEKR